MVFLITYSWEILDQSLSAPVRAVFTGVDYATWVVFALDYVARVALAQDRWRYIGRHLLDLAIVVLPLLRPLRLLRLLVLLRFIERRAASSLQGRVAAYAAVTTVLPLYTGSLAVLDAEHGAPGSTINDFGTALWWGLTTVTTVGYGDQVPVTTQGRVAASLLMLTSIALIGVVAASVSSWLVQRVSIQPEESQHAASIAQLREEVATLTALLRDRIEPAGTDDSVATPSERDAARPPVEAPPSADPAGQTAAP